MMRLSLSSLILLPSALFAQTAQIRWDVQQDRPVPHDVYIWQGETVDLMPRLVQGTVPVAVTNAPVEFRYREDALPTNTYRIVPATANTNSGVLAVRWTPDYDAGAAWYDYQVIVGSNAANPRCFGRITMRQTIGWPASTNAPPPVALFATVAELQAASNALASSVSDITAMFGPVWELNQGLNAHTTSTANPHNVTAAQAGAYPADNPSSFITLAEVPTTAWRWADSADTNVFATMARGTQFVWRVSVVDTAEMIVTLPSDFMTVPGGLRPAWTNHVFPFSDGDWTGTYYDGVANLGGPDSASWDNLSELLPFPLNPTINAQGVAYVSYVQAVVTNLVLRFAMTNEPPAELTVASAFTFQNTQPTNLVLRLSASNEVLVLEHVIP